MLRRSFISAAAALLLSAAPALAHHAFSADFDRDKPVTLDGTVTKVEWTNPHAYLSSTRRMKAARPQTGRSSSGAGTS
jgi:hypothetical protein